MRPIRAPLSLVAALLAASLPGCLGDIERFPDANVAIHDTIAIGTADSATKTYPFHLPAGVRAFTVRQAYDWEGWHEASVHTDRGHGAGVQLTAGSGAERCRSGCPSHRVENLDGAQNWFLTVRVQALNEGTSGGTYSFGIVY